MMIYRGSFSTLKPHVVGEVIAVSIVGFTEYAKIVDVVTSPHPALTVPQYQVQWEYKEKEDDEFDPFSF